MDESELTTFGGAGGAQASGDSSAVSGKRALSPADDPVPGWDRYEIEGFVGEGAMGTVYRARDPILGRTVALKLLRSDDARQVERFQREARAQARIDHECVCPVYEVGEARGRPYIAMRFIRGAALNWVATRLTIEEKAQVMLRVADALAAAHRIGVIHRDIKPANIMVEESEDGSLRPFVLDFGIAREMEAPGMTQTGLVLGTPAFMAPEQVRGGAEDVDRRADVYGFGATLYAVLAGRAPFSGNTGMETMIRVLEDEPAALRRINPRIPRDLETIVATCMDKEPKRRYASAREVAEELRRYLDGEPIRARPAGVMHRLDRWARRNRSLAVVGGVAALVVAVLVGFLVVERGNSRRLQLLARQVGQEIERIDSLVRENRMLPLHDTSAARDLVRERMARLAEAASELGERGEGPRRYALGVGELALGNHQAALEDLEAAWAAGYRSADVAGALGEAMGRVYLARREAAVRIRNAEIRDATLDELDLELRRPAIARLEQGRAEAVDSQLVRDALAALLEDRYDDALRLARDSQRRFPWRYEALLLEAEIVLERARKAEQGGELELAGADHRIAGDALARALEIGRSDPLLYEAEARRLARRLGVRGDREAGEPGPELDRALGMARAAASAAPWRAEPWNLLAKLCWLQADAFVQSGQDPTEHLDLAARHSARAAELDPRDTESMLNGALINRTRASFESQSGRDPRPWLRRAADECRRVLEVDSESALAYANLGVAHYLGAEYELAQGLDPLGSLRAASEALAESRRVRPSFAVSNNLGLVHWQWASAEAQRGGDPLPHLDRASQCYEEAMELNSTHPHPPSNLGLVLLERADVAAERGEDAGPWVERAITALEASVKRAPGFMEALNNLGNSYKARGEVLLVRGDDPTTSLERAVETYRQAIAANPRPAFLYSNLGFAHLRQAEYLQLAGRDPAPALEAARAGFAAALERDPAFAVAHHNEAHAWLVEARARMAAAGDPIAAFERARRAATRSVEHNPGLYVFRAEQAAIEVEAGRWLVERRRDPEREIAAAASALSKAAALNAGSPIVARLEADLAAVRVQRDLGAGAGAETGEAVRIGMEAVARAVASGGEQAETLVVKARLLALAAATGSTAAGPDSAAGAAAALDRAIQLNPLLERRCAEIRRLIPPG